MKKVINITLGSIVFAIEQEAYDVLSTYLESIKQNLSSTDDAVEIISDIESALAEKFLAKKRSEKHAVTIADVEAVTMEMGTPSDFGGESATEEDAPATEAKVSETKKRLYRDTDDSVIAGVASGLARYFEIDPVIVRLIFVVSIFFNGLGLLAYIILWLVVPSAQTTAQKYAMRGEKVTLDQIAQRVKKKIDEVDSDALKNNARTTWGGVRPVLVKVFAVIGVIIKSFVGIFRYIIGFAFLLGGALSLAGLVSVYTIVLLSDKVLMPADAQVALDILLGSAMGIIAVTASFVMMSIPLLVLVLIGGSLVAGRSLFTVAKSITLAVIWIVAIVLAMTASILQLENVMQQLDQEGFESGYYNVHINVDDHGVDVNVGSVSPVEERVESASPDSPVLDLPNSASVTCTEEMKSAEICTMEYAPVCGLVDVQCVTTPCPPIAETFSNGCSACGQGNVDSYTQGACELPEVQ